ncbi:hypothetical protein L3C95_30250 [Chitinophaga filiformis]|uniref:hypothetical protein n=1 Tax=Chitinophaga filiformis TaxID=104663 RepID=UPI001F362690|nr:hypothetical protein [Chitinophaga filiformis]MCF6407217.1 hypothetical protein [Chitinophaga filiformis]
MKTTNFYPFMKVCLNEEYGVVTDQFTEVDGDSNSRMYGVIRWGSDSNPAFEDWTGLWGTFVALGGKEITEACDK